MGWLPANPDDMVICKAVYTQKQPESGNDPYPLIRFEEQLLRKIVGHESLYKEDHAQKENQYQR